MQAPRPNRPTTRHAARQLQALLLVTGLALAAGTTQAQALVDQNKVLAGNVTPGDAAGFPLTISQPGSYKLTSNLYVPDGSHGIDITADDVTLDLNGFMVLGAVTCSQTSSTLAVTCSTGSIKSGVNAYDRTNTTVMNGSVRGFSSACVQAGRSGRFERLSLGHCGTGIAQGASQLALYGPTLVTNTQVQLTRVFGISLFKGLIADSNVQAAGRYGISGPAISTLWLSVRGTNVRESVGGVEWASLRGVVVNSNKTNVANVQSAGSNLVNGAPF
jgi:hypothetical protein